jgi:hypothetical protein
MFKINPEYELIKQDSVNDFLYFTFPVYRILLLTNPENACAIGVRIKGKPAGLLTALLYPPDKTATVVSVFVEKKYRNKGIATGLFTELRSFLTETGYVKIKIEYVRQPGPTVFLEKILTRNGWSTPELKTLLCKIHYKSLLKSGWLTKYRLPEKFSVFQWKDVSPEEKETLMSYENKEGWYQQHLNPFLMDVKKQSPNSLGLRYEGKIVGWIIVQNLSKNSLNYARLFIYSDFRDTGAIIILLSESIKMQASMKIPYGCFSVDVDNRKMKLFFEKRMKPYAKKTDAKYQSFKLL